MIESSQITPVGYIAKMHGTKGEVVVIAADGIPADAIDRLHRVVLDFDGIFVPFFIENVRTRATESVLLKFDDDGPTGTDFESLPGKTLYALRSDLDEILGEEADDDGDGEEGLYLSDLVGYAVVDDSTRRLIGTVTDYDDSTANLLLIVTSPDDRRILIPVADEFFADINADTRTLLMNIPSGLIEMQ